jgi:hypothetical protein
VVHLRGAALAPGQLVRASIRGLRGGVDLEAEALGAA